MKLDVQGSLEIQNETQHGDNLRRKKTLIMQALQSWVLSSSEGPSQDKDQSSQIQQPKHQNKINLQFPVKT